MSEIPPPLRQLRDFYFKKALKLPAHAGMAHASGLIHKPAFFTLAHLQRHLNNPLLTPAWFALAWQGNAVDCTTAMERKPVQKGELSFFRENIIENYLARGASLTLRGLEFLEPGINALCGAIDAPHESVMSSASAFFIQQSTEPPRRLIDAHDTLVLHLAGQTKWQIFARHEEPRTSAEAASPVEIVMNPGDALYLRNSTPHDFAASHTHALHLSIDICDQGIGADGALNLLAQEFDLAATPCYTPAEGVIEKLIEHTQSQTYWKRVHELQTTQADTRKRGREVIGSNRVTHFSRLIAADETVAD